MYSKYKQVVSRAHIDAQCKIDPDGVVLIFENEVSKNAIDWINDWIMNIQCLPTNFAIMGSMKIIIFQTPNLALVYSKMPMWGWLFTCGFPILMGLGCNWRAEPNN